MAISPLALLAAGSAAASLTTQLVNTVAGALPFSDVLKGDGAASGNDRPHAGADTGDVLPTGQSLDVPSGTSDSLKPLATALLIRLSASGVDMTRPIQLSDDGFGNPVVTGDHPDRVLIESILAEDASLAAMVRDALQRHPDADPDEAYLNLDAGQLTLGP